MSKPTYTACQSCGAPILFEASHISVDSVADSVTRTCPASCEHGQEDDDGQ